MAVFEANASVSPGSSSVTSAGAERSGGTSWRRRIALIGIAALLAETIVALMQAPRAAPLSEAPRASLDWWLHPIERNALQRVPVTPGPLTAVFAVRGTDEVWFAGEGGLILHSTNGGATWDSTNVKAVAQVITPPAPTLSTPAQSAPRRAASVRGRVRGESSARVSLASFQQGKAPQYPNAPVQQQAPVQQSPEQKAPQVLVPNVLGMRAGPAQKTIYGAALGVRATFSSVTDSTQADRVVSQRPAAGSRVPAKTEIEVVIGRYAPAVPAPRLPAPSLNVPPSDSLAATRPPNDTTSQTFYPRLTAICMAPTSRMGWAVGERGTAFRTTDRGRTWTQLATGVEFTLAALACDDRLGAIAMTGVGSVWLRPDSAGTVTQGGRTQWLRGARVTFTFGAGDTIWASGDGDPVRYSADTARTWVSRADSQRTVAGIGAGTWFAIHEGGREEVSTDGGRTWEPRGICAPDSAASFSAQSIIVPASATTAIIVDPFRGRVARTTDGWRTCEAAPVFDVAPRVAPASERTWYAAGGGAFRSDDGGRTWHSLVHTRRYASLLFRDSLHGIAGVENGYVAITSDAGRSWSHHRMGSSHTAPAIHFAQRGAANVIATDNELFYRSADGGRTWRALSEADSVVPIVFTNEQTGWGLGGDTVWTTRDGGTSWNRAAMPEAMRRCRGSDGILPDQIERIGVLQDGRGGISELWVSTEHHHLVRCSAAGRDTLATGILAASPVTPTLAYGLDSVGTLVRSTNGGRAWTSIPAAPPRKYPAPWYYAAVALTVAGTLGATRVRRDTEEEDPERSIADILVSDRPLREGDRDVLDFGKIAAGLSRFIRNTRTEPPLTIAITGPWGTGKSSLMNLLRRDLERRRFRTIWFNAWHHQREESLLASLLEVIRRTTTPPVWSWKGMRFRARLLGKRFHRYRAALALLPLFAYAVGFILRDPHRRLHDFDAGFQSIVHVFTDGDTPKSPAPSGSAEDAHPITAPERTVFYLVISIVGTVLTYAKGLKAFGVRPSEIAKSVASAGRVRTIESQPAFRYRFAQDFGEVTQALKPERLVIFVDDLDRCKPEQVLEILESINFLAESGDCVVVLGIDRERVTGCVAIGFKEVATVLAQASTSATPVAKPDIGAATPPVKTNLEYQLEYARHYLEKLLNMEIPIPPATPTGLGNVMTNSGAGPDASAELPPDAVDEARGRARRRRRGRLYATAVGVLSVAFFLRAFVGEIRPRRDSEVAPPSGGAAGVAIAPAGTTDSLGTAPPPGDSTRAKSDTTLRRNPMLFLAGTAPTTAWWWHVPLALAAAGLLLWLVTPREDNRVEDSTAFATALRAWAPVLFEEHPTPRSAKKFLNKMRFLSMAQRAPAPHRAPVESLLDRVREWPLIGRAFRGPREEGPHDSLPTDAIPEVTLVSLNVIRDRFPEWLADESFWSSDLQEYVKTRVDPVPLDVGEALRSLGHIQSRLDLAQYRDAWHRLELWVRDS